MLCCVGLLGGLYVGQSLGGHWTITAPAVGFALGFYGDMKFMHGMHGKNSLNSNRKNGSSSKRGKMENPLLQGNDINTKEVRRDSG